MAGATLFTHAGLSENDFSAGGIRTEMSDTMFASLYLRPNFLSVLPILQFGGGGTGLGNTVMQLIHYWFEDRLNPRTVTDTTGGINSAATTMTISASDANNINVGDVLLDQAQALNVAEFIQVSSISISGSTTTLTISRAFNGTTAASHASAAVYEVVHTPQIQGSDFGRDMSRTPGVKSNLVYTIRKDVQIAGSLLALSKYGMVPGIPNMLAYQLHQRFTEALIDMERSVLKGIGTPSTTQTEYPTAWGLLPMLGYSSPAYNSTSVVFNANGNIITETLLNSLVINILLQGGEVPDAFVMHPTVIDRVARIFRDQLRLTQSEDVRGYLVKSIMTTVGEQMIRLVMTGYMPGPAPGSTTPSPLLVGLDLDRTGIIPFLDQFCFLLSAPTMKDADLMSLIMKWSYELRNTGTDFSYAHQLMSNFTV